MREWLLRELYELRDREVRERGFVLTARVFVAGVIIAAALLAFGFGEVNAAKGLWYYYARYHTLSMGEAFQDRLQSEAAGALAIFVPLTDVNGASNLDGHEIDLYSQDAKKNAYFWAYTWNAAAQNITRYTYAAPGYACTTNNCVNRGVVAVNVSSSPGWNLYTADQFVSVFPVVNALVAQTGLAPAPISVDYGYSNPLVRGGNYVVQGTLNLKVNGVALLSAPQDLATSFTPNTNVAIVGTHFTPTPPPPPIPNPNGTNLLFTYPGAAAQNFTVSEPNYHDWYKITDASACGYYPPPTNPQSGSPYPGTQVGPPTGGLAYAYPKPNTAANTSGTATFSFEPTTSGVCSPTIKDVYAAATQVTFQVMGWLKAQYNGGEFHTHNTTALVIPSGPLHLSGDSVPLNIAKSYDLKQLHPAIEWKTLACATYFNPVALSNFNPATSLDGTPSTVTLTLSLAKDMPAATVCDGTIYDQYDANPPGADEGVAIIVHGAATTNNLNVEPAALVYPQPGTAFKAGQQITVNGNTLTLGGCANANTPIAFGWNAGGTAPNFGAVLTGSPTGSSLTIDGNGCDLGIGGHATYQGNPGATGGAFPEAISASEPGQTTGSLFYNPGSCAGSFLENNWSNLGALPGPDSLAVFVEQAGSQCSITISDQGTGNGVQSLPVTVISYGVGCDNNASVPVGWTVSCPYAAPVGTNPCVSGDEYPVGTYDDYFWSFESAIGATGPGSTTDPTGRGTLTNTGNGTYTYTRLAPGLDTIYEYDAHTAGHHGGGDPPEGTCIPKTTYTVISTVTFQ